MSYRLDPSSGRYVMAGDSASRVNIVDSGPQFHRTLSGNQTLEYSRTNSEGKFTREQSPGPAYGQDKGYASKVAQPFRPEPTRQEIFTNLKNELSNIKTEASRLVTREDSGTRRIILMNNGRRVFDPDNSDRMSTGSDLQARDSITREPITNVFEARILTRDSMTAPKPSTAVVDRGSPFVREFNQDNAFRVPAQPISQSPLASQTGYVLELERKNKDLQTENRKLNSRIKSMHNDGEVMLGDLNAQRGQNAQLKLQLAAMRELEGTMGQLRKNNDELFLDNTRLRNEVSLLKGELQQASLMKVSAEMMSQLEEENSNLKSEVASLQTLRLQYESVLNELNGLRVLQNDYGQLRNELQQLHVLQSENSALKSQLSQANTQLSLLNNEVAMYRAKSGAVESDERAYLENLNQQLQRLQSDISGFEALKRNLQAKFGYPVLTVDDFCDKVFMMLADNISMMEELTLKDEQLEEFRSRMEQNQQAIEQLSSIRLSYEDNLRSLNGIHESDRTKFIELTRQHEEAKVQLKQQAEELAKAQERERIRGNVAEDETVVRLLNNKDVEITKLQVELKNQINKVERLERELEQEKQNLATRLSADKTEILQSTSAEIRDLRNELQIALERIELLERDLTVLQQHAEELTNSLNVANEQLGSLNEQLTTATTDLQNMTELYTKKEKEVAEAESRAERAEAECNSKIERYESDAEMMRMKQENIYCESREQEQQLRRELSEVRSNWHTRLLRQLRTFDEALREQIEELNVLKAKLMEKDDQIFQLKDVAFTAQSVTTGLRAEIEIEKLKGISERKTQQVAYEVELQNVRNELGSAQKSLESMGQKLRQSIEDNRKKDEFIQKYVVGRKPDEKFNIQLFFKQYEILVPSEPLKGRLIQEQRQIEQLSQLNRMLAKQLLAVKQN